MTAEGYLLLEQLRWGGTPPVCPRCGVPGRSYFLTPRTPERRTRTGATTPRRVWKCGACRQQFSVLTGTVLEGTKVGVPTWIDVVADLAAAPVSAGELSRRHGITPETARLILARVEAAVDAGAQVELGSLLRLEPPRAARARHRTPSRRRSPGQWGPSASYGD